MVETGSRASIPPSWRRAPTGSRLASAKWLTGNVASEPQDQVRVVVATPPLVVPQALPLAVTTNRY